MRPLLIVKAQISANFSPRFADDAIGLKLDPFICHRSPQALGHDIVAPVAPAVQNDDDLFAQQHAGEGHVAELANLVVVEDLRLP